MKRKKRDRGRRDRVTHYFTAGSGQSMKIRYTQFLGWSNSAGPAECAQVLPPTPPLVCFSYLLTNLPILDFFYLASAYVYV